MAFVRFAKNEISVAVSMNAGEWALSEWALSVPFVYPKDVSTDLGNEL